MSFVKLPSPFIVRSSPFVLLGGNGQLGWAIRQQLESVPLSAPLRTEVDYLQPERLVTLVERLRPRVIINAAAYTQVDQAEYEPELAYQINAKSVAALGEASRRVGSLLVHFSTDYVFDGGGNRVIDPGGKKISPLHLMSMGIANGKVNWPSWLVVAAI